MSQGKNSREFCYAKCASRAPLGCGGFNRRAGTPNRARRRRTADGRHSAHADVRQTTPKDTWARALHFAAKAPAQGRALCSAASAWRPAVSRPPRDRRPCNAASPAHTNYLDTAAEADAASAADRRGRRRWPPLTTRSPAGCFLFDSLESNSKGRLVDDAVRPQYLSARCAPEHQLRWHCTTA